jgi:hypothetical protein
VIGGGAVALGLCELLSLDVVGGKTVFRIAVPDVRILNNEAIGKKRRDRNKLKVRTTLCSNKKQSMS